MSRPYLALIGDLVGSRDVENRRDVQSRLATIMNEFNHRRDELAIESAFTVTLGDEFQALLSSTRGLWSCLARIDAALHPVGVRHAIGLGPLSTDLDPVRAIGMDGPAFHRARSAMDSLKSGDGRLHVETASPHNALMNAALALFDHQRIKWRPNRQAIFAGRLAGARVDELAAQLGISEQAVYQNISDGALETCAELLHGIGRELDSLLATGSKGTNA